MPDQEPSVLVVDDMKSLRLLLCKVLADLGVIHIRAANNGKAALESLRSQRPEIVFLDWEMPEMSGLEVLQELRKDAELKEVPVVMVSSCNSKEKVVKALQAGANDYIVKPFSTETVQRKLQKFAPACGGNILPDPETGEDHS